MDGMRGQIIISEPHRGKERHSYHRETVSTVCNPPPSPHICLLRLHITDSGGKDAAPDSTSILHRCTLLQEAEQCKGVLHIKTHVSGCQLKPR